MSATSLWLALARWQPGRLAVLTARLRRHKKVAQPVQEPLDQSKALTWAPGVGMNEVVERVDGLARRSFQRRRRLHGLVHWERLGRLLRGCRRLLFSRCRRRRLAACGHGWRRRRRR
uniref:Putative secreted protein n=1 Tax=Ixodes ricinus TaxID=34613 RepID=A0A147BEB0_IXORI